MRDFFEFLFGCTLGSIYVTFVIKLIDFFTK